MEDPDPKNKRDVVVTFFNVDDFCDALVKNGRSILSYNFDVCYDPYVCVRLVRCRNLHRKGSTHGRGGRGGRGGRDNRDGRDGRDNYSRRNSHRDDDNHREQSGDVRNQNYEERRSYRPHNDGNRSGYKSGRYGYQRHDDTNFHIASRGIILHQRTVGVGRRVEGKEQNVVVKSTNRFGSYNSDSDD